MRFHLRTLLVLSGILPPLVGAAWYLTTIGHTSALVIAAIPGAMLAANLAGSVEKANARLLLIRIISGAFGGAVSLAAVFLCVELSQEMKVHPSLVGLGVVLFGLAGGVVGAAYELVEILYLMMLRR